MEIRRLSIEDMDQMLALESVCFPNDPWKKEDWIDLLTDARATYYGLMDSEKLVGNVFTYNWKGEQDYLKIMNLSVHPDYRGKGLAHWLMGQVKEEMTASDLQRICAETRASNKAMQTVFANTGFLHTTTEEACYENPVEDGYKYVFTRKNIAVSACLLGENCKYSGGNNFSEKVRQFAEGHNVISVCPEVMGGLPIPREPAEIVDGVVRHKDGSSVDAEFCKGAELALQKVLENDVELVILQSRSPSCGVGQIYDGTFSGKLIPGDGIFVKRLREAGIPVKDVEDL